MEFSPENNWVEVLQSLPSYKEYEKLDNVDIAKEKGSHCNDIGSINVEDKKLCKKIVQILSKLSELKDIQKLKNSCYYFQHWFFDNIAKKYYNGNDRGKNYTVAEKLFDIVSTFTPIFSEMKPCKCYESGLPNDWKVEKYLHDYFENHQDINCNDFDKSKCEKYVKYVTYIKTLYEKKKYHCCEDEWVEFGCPSYFKCENTYNPKDLLSELKKKLQLIEEKIEAGGAEETLQAGENEKAGTEKSRQEKTKPEIAVAAISPRKQEEGVAAKSVTKESGMSQPGARTPAKTVETKPKETVSEEEANEEKTAEEDVHAISYNTTEHASNALPLTIADYPYTLGTTHKELDSNFFRNVILAIAVLGTILFLFYYNRSSRLEPSSRKKKGKKGKIFEHNYYEEYEKELAMYDSEETFLDSETDRLYLNYHADEVSYY